MLLLWAAERCKRALNAHPQTISTITDPSAWQQALYASLAESHSRTIEHFFDVVGNRWDLLGSRPQ